MHRLLTMRGQFPSLRTVSDLLAAAALIAALTGAAPPLQASGLYEINQMEMAGGLELEPDGRFRYALDYGAVSEEAVGRWATDGDDVLLTTDPMPPPAECDRGFASACFDVKRLAREGNALVLYRWGARILLKPAQRPR